MFSPEDRTFQDCGVSSYCRDDTVPSRHLSVEGVGWAAAQCRENSCYLTLYRSDLPPEVLGKFWKLTQVIKEEFRDGTGGTGGHVTACRHVYMCVGMLVFYWSPSLPPCWLRPTGERWTFSCHSGSQSDLSDGSPESEFSDKVWSLRERSCNIKPGCSSLGPFFPWKNNSCAFKLVVFWIFWYRRLSVIITANGWGWQETGYFNQFPWKNENKGANDDRCHIPPLNSSVSFQGSFCRSGM